MFEFNVKRCQKLEGLLEALKLKHGKLETVYKELASERKSDADILPGKIAQIEKLFEVPKQTNVILSVSCFPVQRMPAYCKNPAVRQIKTAG
jgi:hypothetical protein